jgi:DNA-binding XRE family transcriptional regulator
LAAGVSQETLGRAVGVTAEFICMFERGRRRLSGRVAVRYGEALSRITAALAK